MIFLSETWLKDEQKYILCDFAKDHTVIAKSDMVVSPRFGRPYGGRAWLVRNSIEVIHKDFLNEHISVIVLKKDNVFFTVVGVYMPYDNKSQLSWSKFSSLLILIEEVCQYYVDMGHIVTVAGDFNADPSRGNRFDNRLKSFV